MKIKVVKITHDAARRRIIKGSNNCYFDCEGEDAHNIRCRKVTSGCCENAAVVVLDVEP